MAIRKPIFVIDLTPDQLQVGTDFLESMAQRAAKQASEDIEEIRWRIGPTIIATTFITQLDGLGRTRYRTAKYENTQNTQSVNDVSELDSGAGSSGQEA